MPFWFSLSLSKSQQKASSHSKNLSTGLKFVLSFLRPAVFEKTSNILVFSLPHIACVNEQVYQMSIKALEKGKDYHTLLNLFLLILQCCLEDRFVLFFFDFFFSKLVKVPQKMIASSLLPLYEIFTFRCPKIPLPVAAPEIKNDLSH